MKSKNLQKANDLQKQIEEAEERLKFFKEEVTVLTFGTSVGSLGNQFAIETEQSPKELKEYSPEALRINEKALGFIGFVTKSLKKEIKKLKKKLKKL